MDTRRIRGDEVLFGGIEGPVTGGLSIRGLGIGGPGTGGPSTGRPRRIGNRNPCERKQRQDPRADLNDEPGGRRRHYGFIGSLCALGRVKKPKNLPAPDALAGMPHERC